MKCNYLLLLLAGLLLAGTDNLRPYQENDKSFSSMRNFRSDVEFLKTFVEIDLLQSGDRMVAVSADLQGRVMTSTAQGMNGRSYGWINRPFFESQTRVPHMNPYGGEERFWLGPEGGQFSIFFRSGDDFTLENWQTPMVIDIQPFEITEKSSSKINFYKIAQLTNYAGFTFDLEIDRTIEILSDEEIASTLQIDPKTVNIVGYKSTNRISNIGKMDWSEQTGLLSIWLLGMFNPSDQTTIVIPFLQSEDKDPDSIVKDDYFGKVPSDRLKVSEGVIYFKGDGNYRSKIGLSPTRAKNILGSYDEQNQILTLLQYSKSLDSDRYVNSSWEIQKDPFQGDVINSYNDGPPAPGVKPMGPFYELETSSPAMALGKGESGIHIQYTFHLEGDLIELDKISRHLLGVSLTQISSVF